MNITFKRMKESISDIFNDIFSKISLKIKSKKQNTFSEKIKQMGIEDFKNKKKVKQYDKNKELPLLKSFKDFSQDEKMKHVKKFMKSVGIKKDIYSYKYTKIKYNKQTQKITSLVYSEIE